MEHWPLCSYPVWDAKQFVTALNGGSTYAENASQKDIFGGLYVKRMYEVHSYFLELQNLEALIIYNVGIGL